MKNEATIIHLWWEGPYTMEEAKKLKDDKDRGIYQIYGAYPIYGTDVLLYIGKAVEQTFAERIGQHKEGAFGYSDARRVSVYVGRIIYQKDEEDKVTTVELKRLIDEAEKLLIYAHGPAWNNSNKNGLKDDMANLHIMNWKDYRMLMAEVSTARQVTFNYKCDEDDWPYAKYDK